MRINYRSIFQNKHRMELFIPSRVFWLVFVLYSLPGAVTSLSDIEVFFDDTTPAFNHLAIHSNDGTVFIGAVNRLYKLSLDLILQDNVTTTSYPNPMNYSGILVMDKWDRKLIACGCSPAFVCKIFQFNDGTSKLREISQIELPKLTENNTCGSITAFISRETRAEKDDGYQKLYFAASYLNYASKQPAIAIRSFNNINNSVLDQNSSVYNSDQFINDYRNMHRVKYVYGFESGRYKYFLTTQRDSTAQRSLNVSKLIRICYNGKDPLLQGYTEIPIECKSSDNRVKYNLVQTATIGKPSFQMAKSLNIRLNDSVLFGVFSKHQGMNPSSNELGNHSALCIYSINAIDEKFNENIQNCFNSIESRGFEFKSPNSLRSYENSQKIDSSFCTSKINMPLIGNTPISASSIISFNNLSTAIATKPSGNQTDVFIGTKTGHLKTIILQDVWRACDDADLVIDEGFPVKSDLLFSPWNDSLYVMTKHKLTKMKLKLLDCPSHTSYAKCLTSNNQFCGWCGATNACTRRCNCPLQIEIVEKSSDHFQIGASELLHLYIPIFHSIRGGSSINCAFMIYNNNLMTYGNSSQGDYYNIHCPIPKYSEIAPIQKYKDYLNVTLMIYATRFWGSADTKLIFFNCNSYKFCEICVSSKFECQWHLQEKKCAYNGKNITKDASIISNATYCKNIEKKRNHNIQNITKLSNHTTFPTTNSLGRCLNLANSCISCMDLDTKHSCGWCRSTETCESRASCSGQWIKNHYSCPGVTSPSISSFRPQTGPREGGTIITIEGDNLFYKFEDKDINQRIFVAGIACTPLQNMYVSMKSIACKIEKTNSSPAQTGPVVLHLNGIFIKSTQNFKFVDFELINIYPKEGPLYGGTALALMGKNLNAGRSIEVFVDESSCLVFSRNSSTVQCITSASLLRNESKIFVKMDGNIHNLPNISFSYIEDPERDENGFNLEPRGIPAGNITILIRNLNLTSTQQVLLHIHNAKRIYESSCNISSGSNKTWICLAPIISDIDSNSIDAENPVQMNVSFSNAASNGSYLPSESLPFKFLLYPNPEFHYFLSSSVEFDDNNYVIIVGKNINKACQKTDIKVNVGNITCEVKSISLTQLICSLPKYLSSSDSNDTEEKFDILAKHDTITVSIGVNFTVKVRKQFLFSSETSSTKPPVLMYVMIFIFITISFLISITFFYITRKKTVARAMKKVRKTQLQMTTLELSVAAECKEAFAELQTQITSFGANALYTTLPFLNYRTYVMNVLFPSINYDSIILTGRAILIHKEKGLQSFRELLMNRRFLLSFVRTLENQESFSMNDRVYVASMLMITLQKDMEYCTDILKTLMTELIEKYMRGKGHPKLLLRQTESIVEKMLSVWLSLLLYDFLKESAGLSLFRLFTAIKEHVNRGPVDMITSQARYCLSDNKILRQKLEFSSLTVYVNIFRQTAKIVGLESPIEEIPVQVLDCDTISQFKEKALDVIHRTINFSQKLNPCELSVEWVHDTSIRIILSDVDSCSLTDGEWKQLNTLKHYGVSNGSTLNFISDQEISYQTSPVTLLFDMKKIHCSVKYQPTSSYHKIRKRSKTESTTALIQSSDVSYKNWHLIKPFRPQCNQEDGNGSNEMLPEIFLTRLLATKSSLQKFVDELFSAIFNGTNQNSSIPIAIKYMFDFLDDQARQHNITDPEVVHIWKSNCLPLRFWVNLIKNPNFLFDVHKSNIVDSCLSVIAQVFMDSCSTSEQLLNKDSATTKLLYAKEIPIYNKLVKKYYADIKNMPRISSHDMSTVLAKVSKKYATGFDTNVSIHELFKYATKYKEKLMDALKNDEFSKDNILVLKLEKTMKIINAVSNL